MKKKKKKKKKKHTYFSSFGIELEIPICPCSAVIIMKDLIKDDQNEKHDSRNRRA